MEFLEDYLRFEVVRFLPEEGFVDSSFCDLIASFSDSVDAVMFVHAKRNSYVGGIRYDYLIIDVITGEEFEV